MTAFVVGLALLFGPPSPVLHSQGEQVTAGRGGYCWAGDSAANGLQPYTCADAVEPAADRPLSVQSDGRVRVDMRTETESLSVTLRRRALVVTRVGGARFMVRLPRHLPQGAVLDLQATYPKGTGSFGAQLRVPPPAAPPKPVLRAGSARLVMDRGSYCWHTPPLGLCVDGGAPSTRDALEVHRNGQVRLDMRMPTDLVGASIRGGRRNLVVLPLSSSKRRFIVVLPRRLEQHTVLELFARYPQGDATFGARLALR